MFGFVMRCMIDFKRCNTYIHLFKSLVRSQLEYGVQIWNPYYKIYIENLEAVQHKFLKATHYRCYRKIMSYENLLDFYKLPTLQARRTFLETILLYDLCNNKYDCSDITNQLCYIVPRTVNRRGVRARPLFAVSSSRTNAGQRAPLCRMVKNYNTLSSDLDLDLSFTPRQFGNVLTKTIKR